MRNRFGTLLGFTLVLVSVLAAEAGAGSRPRKLALSPFLRGQSFTVSGSCSGTSAGEIRIDGTSYRLASDARIYEVGNGFVPVGTSLNYRIVSVTGQKVRNTMMVHSVLVRPDDSSGSGGVTGIREESSPE